jgi:hypothetical protein
VGQVANLRPIGNRPVATPKAFSTGCAGLSTVQPARPSVSGDSRSCERDMFHPSGAILGN